MKTMGSIVFLSVLLAFCTQLGSASFPSTDHPGFCPDDFMRCLLSYPPDCTYDVECATYEKCCSYMCKMQCKAAIFD
ncbi:WAP four-disulfide core domain protein 5-like isoform X3 [Microcaecilia unicolor]|uniref:WAP four-disulfide core domain protein 5-like isoform X3 n=1 Tax=Microcaecilia unicolor TaxID=1415580 RepID=A0A6P7YQ49_9AMPH|nr:WAP four-disulfide core domain protein 5-like isoform X3 [Microcaecilia unicolor]